MSQPEGILLADLRLALGADARHSRLFRNVRGTFWAGKVVHSTTNGGVTLAFARQVECGLVDGAGDLIGWTSVVITPDMVGQTVAVFTSGELKVPGGKAPTKEQGNWCEAILCAGGRAGTIRSREDGLALVSPTWRRPAQQAEQLQLPVKAGARPRK